MLVVVLMVLLIGVSYAAWRYTFTGNANTINTPSIELELLESTDEIINISNALPMSDESGKTQTKTFNFAVTTKTASVQDIGYSLKIEKISVDSGYIALNDNQIKVYLTDYNNTELLGPTLISDLSNYVLYSKTNSHSSTTTKIQDKYKLRAWIDFEVDASSWNENTKLQYKFKIGVTEKQEMNNSNAVYSWHTDYIYIGDKLEAINGYTTDYTNLNQSFFLKHNLGNDNTVESNEACYILDNSLYCLKGGSTEYYEENISILYESFGESKCTASSTSVTCSSSNLSARAGSSGYARAYIGDSVCFVDSAGDSYCE